MNLGASYPNVKQKDVVINKVVTGKYVDSSEIENAEIKGHKDPAEQKTEILTNKVNEKSAETEKVEAESSKAQEDQKPIGIPIKAELTAYSDDPKCSGKWGSQTAMQTKTRLGVIAAPSKIPLGSKIYIPELTNYKSDGMFNVEDRGGAIKIKQDGTYIIDVWVPTYEEAEKFGRKYTTIYLL
jgi:3D (Asp-Asp-Asp) domain-containing protein